MKNFTRAQRKKMMRKIKVGDWVTGPGWGCQHPVLDVSARGVIIDASSCGFPRWPVAWDGNARHGVYHAEGGKGPIHKVVPPKRQGNP